MSTLCGLSTTASVVRDFPAPRDSHVVPKEHIMPAHFREVSQATYTPLSRSCLHPGAVFRGTQKNMRNQYDVSVEITNVDMHTSTLGGYLTICGLTKDWPEITTYFEGEIIGNMHSFVTGKWEATEMDDFRHWSRFPYFHEMRDKLGDMHSSYNMLEYPFLYMRWKERFLVPDHKIHHIHGASFAGFYYIFLSLDNDSSMTKQDVQSSRTSAELGSDDQAPDARRGHLHGFYFHDNSEPFQELSLNYVPYSTSGAFALS